MKWSFFPRTPGPSGCPGKGCAVGRGPEQARGPGVSHYGAQARPRGSPGTTSAAQLAPWAAEDQRQQGGQWEGVSHRLLASRRGSQQGWPCLLSHSLQHEALNFWPQSSLCETGRHCPPGHALLPLRSHHFLLAHSSQRRERNTEVRMDMGTGEGREMTMVVRVPLPGFSH